MARLVMKKFLKIIFISNFLYKYSDGLIENINKVGRESGWKLLKLVVSSKIEG